VWEFGLRLRARRAACPRARVPAGPNDPKDALVWTQPRGCEKVRLTLVGTGAERDGMLEHRWREGTRPGLLCPGGGRTDRHDGVRWLQRHAGNRAVVGLVSAVARTPKELPEGWRVPPPTAKAGTRFEWVGTSAAARHLQAGLARIQAGQVLIRRVTPTAFETMKKATSVEEIFRPRTESKRWFSIDEPYVFQKGDTDASAKYSHVLRILLTPELKAWLYKYLIYEKDAPGEKKRERGFFLDDNPCLKHESNQYTLGIPKNSWMDFWAMAGPKATLDPTETSATPVKLESVEERGKEKEEAVLIPSSKGGSSG
jgi:hypothetical protein